MDFLAIILNLQKRKRNRSISPCDRARSISPCNISTVMSQGWQGHQPRAPTYMGIMNGSYCWPSHCMQFGLCLCPYPCCHPGSDPGCYASNAYNINFSIPAFFIFNCVSLALVLLTDFFNAIIMHSCFLEDSITKYIWKEDGRVCKHGKQGWANKGYLLMSKIK